MIATRVTVAALAVAFGASMAPAAETPAGVASCSGCHAANTRVETPVPRLAGRRPAEIADAMIAFKSGTRAGTIMDRIAKGFSDEEIRAIAAWYATQK
jgi:sulfide dehydrogenase cytochrome subunit